MLDLDRLEAALADVVDKVDLSGLGERQHGKVRDLYKVGNKRILITTDRVSAFDRVLGLIPYKGQVLNQLSAWWFGQTADIVANHLLAVPDPNVTVAREAEPLPVEIVVRGYITGVTTTSLWYLYEQGDRTPYGIPLPDGLQKNDPLPTPIITPTTKAEKGQHDERLTRQEILERGLVAPALYAEIERAALGLFARGQEVAARAGLILVDTKYEFGLVDGQLTLIDEIHTPDSSRYWVADSYQRGTEPENYDKEFLRKWFAARGYRGDGEQPVMPPPFVAQVAQRYIGAYEKLTGTAFTPGELPAQARIQRNLEEFFATD
ncbi:MAG: phosphoribosylaminoimidazolesuccinocarboxamide synthase, partial [Anaerolineales bacterium]|nr:phosphoribosylaminoimidazolesuccinocarboxamide synthase [Anaerolineales bacterium]